MPVCPEQTIPKGRAMVDVIVVGAGVVGSSTAFHLAESGANVVVLDPQQGFGGQTPRSGGIVRDHHATTVEADLARESLTEYYESWSTRIGGACGFTRTGFAYLADEGDAEALRANVAMLRAHGVPDELLTPEELAELEPAISTEAISVASYEERSGYADPAATTISLQQAARRRGARFERLRVSALVEESGRVVGVRAQNGVRRADAVVLATGAWTPRLTATVGLDLPIRPARIQVMLYERPYELTTHLTMTDVANDIYLRPTADRCTLVGRHAPEREWLDDPDADSGEPDTDFVAEGLARLGRRIPAMAEAPYRLGRTCALDITPDGRPILGPSEVPGLHLAVGWSGSGFGKAPAIGAELARWILTGAPKRPELTAFTDRRFATGALIRGDHEYGATGPH
ncbi:sarcosine oxidase subunit beta [Saccharopolyspora antimicrobica]|uniref:Glycine/D-amino acid oxidase-like deaminating enzyme n=2 Tax=Saccharopolyspora antimicrobica TaxID=455193 RepID=A0A1I5C1P4_9PSEU|nr:glycine/D-amino acid oxidase-like deaminating enzyme [Saccharopolyspora antimicrobica]SFN80571.1 sarcosine oxidase subunit beta [Saccharopolyspora antimicrobica]